MIDVSARTLKTAGGFLLLALLVYGWSLGGSFLNWDDPTYIADNAELRGWSGLGSIFTTFHFANYNPLHRLTYWCEWQLVGDRAWLFRLTNLLLHVGNAVLLYELLRAWLGRSGVALVAALLFLVHPSNVETVAWVSERKSLLATGFALGSVLLWLRGRRGLALVLFVLGLMSKTSIVPLPLLLVAIDLGRRADWRANIGYYAAFLVPALGFGIAQILAAQAGEAVRGLHGGSVASHVATIVAVVPYYAFHLVLPFWLTPRHGFGPATLGDPRCLVGIAMLAAIAFGCLRSWRGERRFAVAALWGLSALLVTVIVPIPIILADRYTYFAMPLMLGVLVDWASRRQLGSVPQWRFAATALLAVCAVVTFDYARIWRDSTALWSHAIERNPTDIDAWISLGAAQNARGDKSGAILAYNQALTISPENAEAIESLANVELQIGRLAAAEQRLTALVQRSPARIKARLMLAACYDLQGNVDRAVAEFLDLLQRHGNVGEPHRALMTFLERHPDRAAQFSVAAPGR